MRHPSDRHAFALIELPAVLILLFVGGLFVAFVFSLFAGPAPWYAWILAGAILPVMAILFGIGSFVLERRFPDVVATKRGPHQSSRALGAVKSTDNDG